MGLQANKKSCPNSTNFIVGFTALHGDINHPVVISHIHKRWHTPIVHRTVHRTVHQNFANYGAPYSSLDVFGSKKILGKIAQNAAPPWPSFPGVETPRSRAPPPATRAQRALRALRAGWVAPLGQWESQEDGDSSSKNRGLTNSSGDLTMKKRRCYQIIVGFQQ